MSPCEEKRKLSLKKANTLLRVLNKYYILCRAIRVFAADMMEAQTHLNVLRIFSQKGPHLVEFRAGF